MNNNEKYQTPQLPLETHLLIIRVELEAASEETTPAFLHTISREVVKTLERNGYTLRPVYTGKRGGPLLVEVVQQISLMAEQIWASRAAAEELFADGAALLTVCGAALPCIHHICRAHEQEVSGDEDQAQPIEIAVEIDGARITVEARDLAQTDAALVLARRFLATHPQKAPHVTLHSTVTVVGRIPPKPHRRKRVRQ